MSIGQGVLPVAGSVGHSGLDQYGYPVLVARRVAVKLTSGKERTDTQIDPQEGNAHSMRFEHDYDSDTGTAWLESGSVKVCHPVGRRNGGKIEKFAALCFRTRLTIGAYMPQESPEQKFCSRLEILKRLQESGCSGVLYPTCVATRLCKLGLERRLWVYSPWHHDVLQQLRIKEFSEEQKWRLGRSLIETVCHLHKMGIAHRDIKPENILIGEEKCLVTDFDDALLKEEEEKYKEMPGTVYYFSPEYAQARINRVIDKVSGKKVIEGRTWDKICETDVWGLASVLGVLFLAHPPFRFPHPATRVESKAYYLQKIASRDFSFSPAVSTNPLCSLLHKTINPEVEKQELRSAEAVLQFFKTIDPYDPDKLGI